MSSLELFLKELKLTPKQVKRHNESLDERSSKKSRKKRSKRKQKIESGERKIESEEQKRIKKYIKEMTEDEKEILLNNIEKYGIGDYTKEQIDLLGMKFIIDLEKDRHKFLKERYTDKQLQKTIDKIKDSFIIRGSIRNPCKSKAVIDYLCFIEQNPAFALPTLLWLDTFHDFKHERLYKDTRAGEETIQIDRNKILDYLCYRIYGHHWAHIKYKDIIEDCVYIGHEYNFDKMYQNSFFNFDIVKKKSGIKVKVNGFHSDVIHTVLRPLVIDTDNKTFKNNPKVAELLYNVSNVFIANSGGWELEFLNAYIFYNFNFKGIQDAENIDILEQLKDISWSEIKEDHIPYYAKDVDEGSGNFLKGDLVIIPASLFDSNRSNSSEYREDFVTISSTKIPLCNGYDFEYKYNDMFLNNITACKLDLKYGDNNIIPSSQSTMTNILCDFISPSSLTIYDIKNIAKNIKTKGFYTYKIPDNIKNGFNSLLSTINNNYFSGINNCVKIPFNKQGMSPVDIVDIIIGLLYRDFFNNNNGKRLKKTHNDLSPISCKILDFWVALKRIGDFGQILQCKQLGIPFFTDDSMQILISIAACSSVVFTIDNVKVLYYKGDIDSFVCSDITTEYNNELNEANLIRSCNVERINPKYKDIINKYFENNTTENVDKKLKNSAKSVISSKFNISGVITNIRKNCKVDIEEKKPTIVNPPDNSSSLSQPEPTFSYSLSSNSS